MDDKKTLSEWREARNLTKAALQRLCGRDPGTLKPLVSANVITLLERGEMPLNDRRRAALARALGIKPSQIADVVKMGDTVRRRDDMRNGPFPLPFRKPPWTDEER